MSNNLTDIVKKLTASIDDAYKNQVPYAASVALNKTAMHAQNEAVRQMKVRLDKPNPFTLNGIAVVRGSKHNLVAKVLVKDLQAKYIEPSAIGGRFSIGKLRPANIKLNQYGNITGVKAGKKIASLVAKGDSFIAKINGVNGVWTRIKKARDIRLMIRFVDSKPYDKRYPFYDIVMNEAAKQFEPEMRKSLNHAIATAFK